MGCNTPFFLWGVTPHGFVPSPNDRAIDAAEKPETRLKKKQKTFFFQKQLFFVFSTAKFQVKTLLDEVEDKRDQEKVVAIVAIQ